jgi:hypothetical protein
MKISRQMRIKLEDLPVDVFRAGILTNLMHYAPEFAGHYF